MPNYIVNSADLTDIADAIREKGETSALLEFPDDFVNSIEAIQSGGVQITDGIVIKARGTNDYATEVDFYGTTVQPTQFYNRIATDGPWKDLQQINFKNTVIELKNYAFYYCQNLVFSAGQLDSITTIGAYSLPGNGSITLDLPSLTSVGQCAFLSMLSLTTINMPKLTNCNVGMFLRGCSALQNVTMGSVGYAVTAVHNSAFMNNTQTDLTVTVYTTGDRADTIVTNIRNSATAATIVIKAAEATTYNGTSYVAGDTMLTSEVAS